MSANAIWHCLLENRGNGSDVRRPIMHGCQGQPSTPLMPAGLLARIGNKELNKCCDKAAFGGIFLSCMNAEILEIKPGIAGISVNLRALWSWIRKRTTTSPVEIVGQRFIKLFEDHGVSITQIPRLVPELPLVSLHNSERLLASLTPALLDQAALMFNVNRGWLEGTTDSIYDTDFCYMAPERFFNALLKISRDTFESPACFLFDGRRLDNRVEREQPLALVMREKIAEFGGEDIFRYRVFGDDWNWSYVKCRVQLKSMIRIVEQTTGRPIHLFPCRPDELANIRGGGMIPRRPLVGRHEKNAPLEDYVLSASESVQARETEELPHVLQYIENYKLAEMCFPKAN